MLVGLALTASNMRSNTQVSDPWQECLTQYDVFPGNPPTISITCVTQDCTKGCKKNYRWSMFHDWAWATCACGGSTTEKCCDLEVPTTPPFIPNTVGSCPACNEPGMCTIIRIDNEDGSYTKIPSCEGIGV